MYGLKVEKPSQYSKKKNDNIDDDSGDDTVWIFLFLLNS